MKTSQILASLFFGSLAAAAPINQRDLVTKTEMVMETVVVYTTIWDDAPVAEATTTPAAFYEQPTSAIVEAKPTTTPTPTPAAVQTPVSVYTPPVQTPSPKPEAPKVEAPKPVVSAAPKPETTTAPAPEPATSAAPAPKPETTEAPAPAPAPTTSAAPAPAPTTSAAPAPAASSAPAAPSYGSPSGDEFSGDITIYQTMGGYGACGTQLSDEKMIVALAQPAWGASTYDVMTGASSNPWCGQKIQVHYKGNTIEAEVADMCPGCTGHDIDLSPAAWKALTGSDEMTRYQATWSKMSS